MNEGGEHSKSPQEGPGPKWQQHAQQMREKLGQQTGPIKETKPWSSGNHRLQGVPTTPRVKELLDLAVLNVMDAALVNHPGEDLPLQVLVKDLYVDCSQASCRKPWSVGFLRTFTTNSQLYSFSLDRVLVPDEQLRALGFRGNLASHLHYPDVVEMAGQSMALCSIAFAEALVIAALFQQHAIPDLFQRPG